MAVEQRCGGGAAGVEGRPATAEEQQHWTSPEMGGGRGRGNRPAAEGEERGARARGRREEEKKGERAGPRGLFALSVIYLWRTTMRCATDKFIRGAPHSGAPQINDT